MNQNHVVGGEVKSGVGVLIVGHKCYRCGHEWRPYDIAEVPRVCPKCKNPYWDRPRKSETKKKVKS